MNLIFFHKSIIPMFIKFLSYIINEWDYFLISLAGSDGAALSISQTNGLSASQTGLLV